MFTIFDHYPFIGVALVLSLLAAILAFTMVAGFRLRIRFEHPEGRGLGVIESSVFAVFGLLVAFTFTGAANRFTERRATILAQAQTAMSAWDQLGLLTEPARGRLRAQLRSYVDQKLAAYENRQDLADLQDMLDRSDASGAALLAAAAEACRAPENQAHVSVVIPTLSRLREISLARKNALWDHPPLGVFVFLIALSLVCAFFSGFSLPTSFAERRLQIVGFSLVIAGALYITMDLEYPRMGLLRVDAADAMLRDVRDAMR
jgi:hypothetical protein